MQKIFSLKMAAYLVLATSALHALSHLVGGFNSFTAILLGQGILGFLAGYFLLTRRWRWLAWLCFFATLFGAVIAYMLTSGFGPIPGWWFIGIMVADILAAVVLFINLWGKKPALS